MSREGREMDCGVTKKKKKVFEIIGSWQFVKK